MAYKTGSNRKPAGYTLIEIVVVIAVLGLVSVGFAEYIARSTEMYIDQIQSADLHDETLSAMERISHELREAAVAEGSMVDPVTTPAPGHRTTTLEFSRLTAPSCAGCVDKSTAVTFYFTPGNSTLWRSTMSAPDKVLADDVSQFSVTASSGTVEKRTYQITLARKSSDGSTVTMATTIFPQGHRNRTWKRIIK